MLLLIPNTGIASSPIQGALKAAKKVAKYAKRVTGLNEFGRHTLKSDNRIIVYSSNFDPLLYKQLNPTGDNSPWHLVTDLVLVDYDVNIYNGKPRNRESINDRIIKISGDNENQSKDAIKERKGKDTYKIIEENPDIKFLIKLNFDFDNMETLNFGGDFIENLKTELDNIFQKVDTPSFFWQKKEQSKGVILDFGIQTNKADEYLKKLTSLGYEKTLVVYANNYTQLSKLDTMYSKTSFILHLSKEVKQNVLIEDISSIQQLLIKNETLNKKTITYAPMLTNSISPNGDTIPMFPPHEKNDINVVDTIISYYQAFGVAGNQGFMIGPIGVFKKELNDSEIDEDTGKPKAIKYQMHRYNADFFLKSILSGSNYTANHYGMVLYMILFFFFVTPLAWFIAPNLEKYFLVRNRIYYDKNVFENADEQLSQNRKYRKKYLVIFGVLIFIWLLFFVILFTDWLKFGEIDLSFHGKYFPYILIAFAVLNLVIPMFNAGSKPAYKFYIKPIVDIVFFLKPKGFYQRIVKAQKVYAAAQKNKVDAAPKSKYSTLKKCAISVVIFALLNIRGWQFDFPATTIPFILYLIGFIVVTCFAYNLFNSRATRLAVLLDENYLSTFPKDTQTHITKTYPQYGAKIKDDEES